MAPVSSSFRALSGAASFGAALWVSLTGCFPSNPSFADARQPRGVRVLGALSSPASGAPGADIGLQLEVFDGASLFDEAQRAAGSLDEATPITTPLPLSVAWLGGCHNPPGDAPSGCYPLLQEIAARLPDPVPDSGADIAPEQARFFGVGTRFSVHVPETILEGRQLATSAAPFGVSFSFFAVCRGVLHPAPAVLAALPFTCHDRDTDEPLTSEAFVQGFVTTYTYAGALNLAPALLGTPIEGAQLPVVGCQSDADCAGLGVGELATVCARPLAPLLSVTEQPAQQRCLPLVQRCTMPPCANHLLLPELSPSSVEDDPSAAPPGSTPPREILWVRYFGFGGFSRSEALINDRASGLNPDYALRWTPPPLAFDSPLPVWAVVQDNRGGTAIARWDFVVRDIANGD